MTKSKVLTTLATALVAVLVTATLPAAGPKDASPDTDAARTYETLKALAGKWQGETGKGETVEITYEVLAGGHSVLERFVHSGHGEAQAMLTVYHLDGDSLMLTHYCMAGNQPRMRAAAYSDHGVRFELVDVTDLASPNEGHMHRAEFEFDGTDRFSTAWTFRENGADQFTEAVQVARVK